MLALLGFGHLLILSLSMKTGIELVCGEKRAEKSHNKIVQYLQCIWYKLKCEN